MAVLVIFGPTLAVSGRSQSHVYDSSPFGCKMTVLNLIKTAWTVFEKFKRLGEKRCECMSSRKFFRLLKKPEERKEQDGNV